MRKLKRIFLAILAIVLLSFVCVDYIRMYSSCHQPCDRRSVADLQNPSSSSSSSSSSFAQKYADEQHGHRRTFLVYDASDFSSSQPRRTIRCSSCDIDVVVSNSPQALNASRLAVYHMNMPPPEMLTTLTENSNSEREHEQEERYSMVYALESEVHSSGGSTWDQADFRMWYNLDESFPEPATYFDVRQHLVALLAPPLVPFELKASGGGADVIWCSSNCASHNGRERFVGELMRSLAIHSYGRCLNNKQFDTAPTVSNDNNNNNNMSDTISRESRSNVALYAAYKFVVVIENSNCVDYVTEKLVQAVASGAIPIVAARDSRPDYTRFMPAHSFINVYDFANASQLAAHIEQVASNKSQHDSYIYFKLSHGKTRAQLDAMPMVELIKLAREHMRVNNNNNDINNDNFGNERFFAQLVAKEKSEDKLCKVARYVHSARPHLVRAAIEAVRTKRPTAKRACLPHNNLVQDFAL